MGLRVALAFAAFGAIGLGIAGRSAAKPYAMVEDERARAFARWFWQDRLGGTPTFQLTEFFACEHAAMPFHLQPQFLCYRAMFAMAPTPHMAERVPARLDGETWFTVHMLDPTPQREAVVAGWRQEMEKRYRPIRAERFEVNPGKADSHGVYVVLSYAP
jgi:hypothetical protein